MGSIYRAIYLLSLSDVSPATSDCLEPYLFFVFYLFFYYRVYVDFFFSGSFYFSLIFHNMYFFGGS